MTIRDQIKAALLKRGISQRELAKRAGYCQQYVNRYLAGRSDVSTEAADRLLRAIGIRLRPGK